MTSHLVKLAIPVLLSHLMMVLLNTVDMIVVGQGLGEVGTSSVSIGGSVAIVFGILLKWGYMGYWFETTLAELVPISICTVFYFVSVQKN